MILTKEQTAILDKFEFDLPPVGVKFLAKPPDMVEPLKEKMAFCEMLKSAQQGNAFFAAAENHACEAGSYVLGQADAPEPFINGEFGAGLQIYEAPRTASRLYQHIPKLGKGVVHYVAFAPLDKLYFRCGYIDSPRRYPSDGNHAAGIELQNRANVDQQVHTCHRMRMDLYLSLSQRGTQLHHLGSRPWHEAQRAVSGRPPDHIHPL